MILYLLKLLCEATLRFKDLGCHWPAVNQYLCVFSGFFSGSYCHRIRDHLSERAQGNLFMRWVLFPVPSVLQGFLISQLNEQFFFLPFGSSSLGQSAG